MNIALVGGLILIVSLVGGWLLSVQKKSEEKPIKIMLFMVYFWLLFFVQLAILAIVYYYDKKYGLEWIIR
ncbi:MAG: hypothetical protein KJ725_02870 [Gammaproteobacteria bacterium]|nr:hypothetical protein [Gammaproteobacteria bacterium]